MNFDNYIFRPHAIGKIMGGIPKPLTEKQAQTLKDFALRESGEGRALTQKQRDTLGSLRLLKNAKPTLTDGAKKYLRELAWQDLTKRNNYISNKYTEKGIEVEEKSISLYSEVTGRLYLKNKKRLQNDYFNGECDIAKNNIITDIKSSWDVFSFPFDTEVIPSNLYKWQGRGYMNLWDMDLFKLVYCLVDTPIRLINDELRKLNWNHNIFDGAGITESAIPFYVETVSKMLYTNKGLEEFVHQSADAKLEWFENFREIPSEMRVKVFELERCQKAEQQMIDMIELARAYMNTLLEQTGDSIIKLKTA